MMWKNGDLFPSVPFPKVEDRPLLVYHPAPDMNYVNSWSIMVENDQPFILFCDDMGPRYPDDLPFLETSLRMEYFARIANPLIGGRAYRHPELGYQNMLVQRQKDANLGIEDLPLLDILYVDWLEPFIEKRGRNSYSDIIPKLATHVRDGGLIILDRKHAETIPEWFTYSQIILSTKKDVCIEHIGRGEWLIPYVDLENVRDVEAEIFVVKNLNQEKKNMDDFLASLMHERRLKPNELLKTRNKLPLRWPGHPDKDSWMERYMEYLDRPESGEPYLPCPYNNSWSYKEYTTWVQSLIDRPEVLRPIPRKERTLDLGIKVTLVHGDIRDHLDWLYVEDASLILREKLMSNCLSNWCWLQYKAVDLQPKWNRPLITKLKWSGKNSTPNLTLEILDLAKSSVVATIAHGDGSLKQLKRQLKKYQGEVEHLIIFHKDACDYSD